MGRFPRAVRLSYSLTLDTNLAEFLVGQLMRMLLWQSRQAHSRQEVAALEALAREAFGLTAGTSLNRYIALKSRV